MDIRSKTKQRLKEHYPQLDENAIPEKNERGKWKLPNKLGFLLGIILHGLKEDVEALYELLNSSQEEVEKELEVSPENLLKSTLYIPTFIDRLFNFYIATFHKNYSDSESCRTPATSRPSSAESITKEPKELTHKNLKDSVSKRDGVCLFCWNILECEGAHIIAQKIINTVPNDESSVLTRCGLQNRHQIQNGMLLCKICHSQFDKLKRYVDESMTNDTTSEKHRKWEKLVRNLRIDREKEQNDWTDGRQAILDNSEMPLYFVDINESIQPNRAALAFHKTACLIWRMAGGAETEDEECSDDEELGPVNTAELRKRFNISSSDATLYPLNY
ncbi:hypothetical protein HDV06_002077 [Boothiomyces sp. JEL0866]|nr:hypothetical protein HDV06_002077 [Boothiomyces sp. JEL0866]